MEWASETFKKFYPPGGIWHSLSVSTRGTWIEMHHYVDNAGCFSVREGQDVLTCLGRAMSIEQYETQRFALDLIALQKAGFITIDPICITITNYVAAQKRTGPYARQAYLKIFRPWGPWLTLRLSARALGKEFLYRVNPSGKFEIHGQFNGRNINDATPDIIRAFGMYPGDRRRVAQDLEALLDDRYLISKPGELIVRNYETAQSRVGSGAIGREITTIRTKILQAIRKTHVTLAGRGPGGDLEGTWKGPGGDLEGTWGGPVYATIGSTARNHSGESAENSLVGRKVGRQIGTSYPSEPPEGSPRMLSAEASSGLEGSQIPTEDYKNLQGPGENPLVPSEPISIPQKDPEPEGPRTAVLSEKTRAELKEELKEEMTEVAMVTAAVVAHDAATSRLQNEDQDEAQNKRVKLFQARMKRSRKKLEAGQAQLALNGMEKPPPTKFTVSDLIAVLTTKSNDLLRVETVPNSMAAQLGKEIQDLHQAERTLEDIARVGEFIAAGHFRSFPGGCPNLPFFAMTGQLEGLIVHTAQWDRAGRPSPEVWRRNRTGGGYQTAPTNEQFFNDPMLQTAKRTEAGYYEINPWGNAYKSSKPDDAVASGGKKA